MSFLGLTPKDALGIAVVAIAAVALAMRIPAIGPVPSGKKILGAV